MKRTFRHPPSFLTVVSQFQFTKICSKHSIHTLTSSNSTIWFLNMYYYYYYFWNMYWFRFQFNVTCIYTIHVYFLYVSSDVKIRTTIYLRHYDQNNGFRQPDALIDLYLNLGKRHLKKDEFRGFLLHGCRNAF